MEKQADRLRREVGGTGRGTLEKYFDARKVRSCETVPDLEADGVTRPLGSAFSDGFAIKIKAGLPGVRRRFTEAHELCHTFFYELVPELKFRPHDRDPLEERLCNHGAAVLLVPREWLAELVGKRPVSLATLDELCELYGVSQETMFMRLRHLGLWDCQLSIWHRSTAGRYLTLQAYGWKRAEWNWVHEDALEAAWTQPRAIAGRTFVYREDRNGRSFARPIQYEARRRGSVIAVLSSNRPLWRTEVTQSLFAAKHSRIAATRV